MLVIFGQEFYFGNKIGSEFTTEVHSVFTPQSRSDPRDWGAAHPPGKGSSLPQGSRPSLFAPTGSRPSKTAGCFCNIQVHLRISFWKKVMSPFFLSFFRKLSCVSVAEWSYWWSIVMPVGATASETMVCLPLPSSRDLSTRGWLPWDVQNSQLQNHGTSLHQKGRFTTFPQHHSLGMSKRWLNTHQSDRRKKDVLWGPVHGTLRRTIPSLRIWACAHIQQCKFDETGGTHLPDIPEGRSGTPFDTNPLQPQNGLVLNVTLTLTEGRLQHPLVDQSPEWGPCRCPFWGCDTQWFVHCPCHWDTRNQTTNPEPCSWSAKTVKLREEHWRGRSRILVRGTQQSFDPRGPEPTIYPQ